MEGPGDTLDAASLVSESLATQRALAIARASWPNVNLSQEVFGAYLMAVGILPIAVESHAADLALACACANRDKHALLIFEKVHISCIASHVARLQLSAEALEELQQLIRVKLFTGPSPRISRYSGKGPLGAWLRILAIRLALDELKAQPPEAQFDIETIDSFIGSRIGDPSARIVWRPQLREAIESSLADLPTREKTVLRMHYIEGLNIEAIGTLYQVHRATVARWLLAIRGAVLAKTRERLSITTPLTTSEVRSAFVELEAELYVSVSRVLGTGRGAERGL